MNEGTTPTRAVTRSRLAWTFSGASSVRRPRLRLAYGPPDTPPRRVVNTARAPGRSIATCSSRGKNGAGRSTPRRLSGRRGGQGVRELGRAVGGSPVELGGQRGPQSHSHRRAARHAGGQQILAGDLESHVAQALEPRRGRLGRSERP